MVKRFIVGGTTRDKEYVLTRGAEGSKVLYFSVSEDPAEVLNVKLRPKPKLRKTEFEFDLNSIEVKGRGSVGNILSRNLVAKITKGGSGRPVPKSEQLAIEIKKLSATIASDKKKNAEPVKEAKKAVGKQKPAPSKAAAKPAVKAASGKISKPVQKKVQSVKEDKAVTMEWDMATDKKTLQSNRDRIVSELEKKNAEKKKSQMKMNL